MSDTDLQSLSASLIRQEGLPASYQDTVTRTILPLAGAIRTACIQQQPPLVVGIHGAQGTGKSTLTLFLQNILQAHFHLSCAAFSLDDIYLTRAEREQLAQRVHPLLRTRGVPGTHDVALGLSVLEQLRAAGPDTVTPVPAFDKARDDRLPPAQWPLFRGRPDIILFEGWCMAARPQADADLVQPVNVLEAEEDRDGRWRRYVNDCLRGPYRELFATLDTLVMLKAPSMDCVLAWRTLQEHRLAEKVRNAQKRCNDPASAAGLRIMSDQEVARFVMHYQRVTEHCLREMPARADVLIEVAADHGLSVPPFPQYWRKGINTWKNIRLKAMSGC